jgi:hypothetical protein
LCILKEALSVMGESKTTPVTFTEKMLIKAANLEVNKQQEQ